MSRRRESLPHIDYEQQLHRCEARFLDPRLRSTSNTSPCGNQPAFISLTVKVEGHVRPPRPERNSRNGLPGTIIPKAVSLCPLDKQNCITAVGGNVRSDGEEVAGQSGWRGTVRPPGASERALKSQLLPRRYPNEPPEGQIVGHREGVENAGGIPAILAERTAARRQLEDELRLEMTPIPA
jgi:hypothetical protein